VPNDRDSVTEPDNEFTELAKDLGDDLLGADEPAAGGTTSEPATGTAQPNPQWAAFPADSPIGRVGGQVRGFRRIRWGRPTPPFKSGPFKDDDGCLRGCFYPLGCLAWLLIGILVVIVATIFWLDDGGDGDGNLVSGGGIEASPSASASPGASAEASPEPSTQPTETPLERAIMQVGHLVIDEFLDELYWTTDIPEYELDLIHDDLLDILDSISGRTPSYQGPPVDIQYSLAGRGRFMRAGILKAWGNTIYECGANDGVRVVVCPSDVQPMPEAGGDVWLFAMSVDGEVPLASPDRSFIYSAVFDSDGEAANDWQFYPPYDFDLFRDTDRWYQLIWSHQSQQWSLTVTQIDANQNQTSFSSAVRAVIQGDTIVFFIPASEFALEQPPYRLTAFGHDGFFSENDRGADVTGADPTEPLIVPSGNIFIAMPEDRAP
jgi:hypothetical protein